MTTHWKAWLIVGMVAVVGGIVAVLNPFRDDIVVEVQAINLAIGYYVGWLFTAIGAATAYLGWRDNGGLRWRLAPIGAAILAVGLFLLLDPRAGMKILTVMMSLALIVSGGLKAALGLEMRSMRGAWWIIGAGAVSLLVGLLILVDFPSSADIALVIFLAIDLIATGAMLILMAIRYRSGLIAARQ
jgi:uncharacterized membrane protein HdeD (DUF308 family)